MGFVSVSECCQPQRECPRQNGPLPAHWDLCHCSNSPAHCAGAPPFLSACTSLSSVLTLFEYLSNLSWKCDNNFISVISDFLRICFLSIVSIFPYMSLLQGYLLSCAESVASQSETKLIPDCLRWLFTPLGRQFFLSCDWSVKSESSDSVYTSQRDPGKSVKELSSPIL